MYHSISEDRNSACARISCCTSPQRFREQMQWLKDNGCRGVTLSAGLDFSKPAIRTIRVSHQLPRPAPAPPPSARRWERAGVRWDMIMNHNHASRVITFDDGFRDFYTKRSRAPGPWILRHHVLPTGFIGNHPAGSNPRMPGLGGGQELHHSGIEFGSHTVHHPNWLTCPG